MTGTMNTSNHISLAIEYFNSHKAEFLNDLTTLVRIPSISFPGFDPVSVKRSAEATEKLLSRSGLRDVRILDTGTGHASVFGQWSGNPEKPTILLYAHHDVQPIGREELWTTPPFEPTERNGRLYGRGVSDDKGGVVMHTSALRSFFEAACVLPINVKVLVDGEEEVGSENLLKLLQHHQELLFSDIVLIADGGNFDSTIPSLTTSLRGIVTVNVEVRSFSSSVHSGTWGGPL